MLGFLNDFDRTFVAMDEFRKRMERAYAQSEEESSLAAATWPRVSLRDTGAELVVKADVPGVPEGDVHVELTGDVLTLSGERKTQVPDTHAVHRRERTAARFSRSFTLPFKVTGEAVKASLENGILTIVLPKAPEAQPRQITVKAA